MNKYNIGLIVISHNENTLMDILVVFYFGIFFIHAESLLMVKPDLPGIGGKQKSKHRQRCRQRTFCTKS